MAKKVSQKMPTPEERREQIQKLIERLKASQTPPKEIKAKADDLFSQVQTQRQINIIIDQYVVTEDFINRIRRYARQEFDSMLLKVFIWFAGITAGTATALLLSGWLK